MRSEYEINIEPVTRSEVLGIDSWNRQVTDEELNNFIETRSSAISDQF